MANYLPVLLVSVSAGLMPDDASLQPLPTSQVDYLSHDWAAEEDVWRSWRNMTKQKREIANGVRLENASWRTWWKQRNGLGTISPETLNWLKDSDVTWLYGPLHTAIDWAPPPGPRPPISPPSHSGSNTPSPSRPDTTTVKSKPCLSSPSSSTDVSVAHLHASHSASPPPIHARGSRDSPNLHAHAYHNRSAYGPGYSYNHYGYQSPSSMTPGGQHMRPILKHRSISEMLTAALPPVESVDGVAYNSINPVMFPPPHIIDEDMLDSTIDEEEEEGTLPLPSSTSNSYFPPDASASDSSSGTDSDGKRLGPMRPKMQHTRSDTNVLRRLAHRDARLRLPRVAAAVNAANSTVPPHHVPSSHAPTTESYASAPVNTPSPPPHTTSSPPVPSSSSPPLHTSSPVPSLRGSRSRSTSSSRTGTPSSSSSLASQPQSPYAPPVPGVTPYYASLINSGSTTSTTTSANPAYSPYAPYTQGGSQSSQGTQGSGGSAGVGSQVQQPQQQPPKKHISFNAIVSQCISIDSDEDAQSPSAYASGASYLGSGGPLNGYSNYGAAYGGYASGSNVGGGGNAGRYSARRIWEEYGEGEEDSERKEEEEGYDYDIANLAPDLEDGLFENSNNSSRPSFNSQGSYDNSYQSYNSAYPASAQHPSPRPALPHLPVSSSAKGIRLRTPSNYQPQQEPQAQQQGAYSRTGNNLSDNEDGENEDDVEDEDDVIEIRTGRRTSTASFNDGSANISQQHLQNQVVPSFIEDDRPSNIVPVTAASGPAPTPAKTRKPKPRRDTGGAIRAPRMRDQSDSGSGSSTSTSTSRSRSGHGARYPYGLPPGVMPPPSAYLGQSSSGNAGYGGSLSGTYTGMGTAELVSIAPIAPTMLKAGGSSGDGGDEDEEEGLTLVDNLNINGVNGVYGAANGFEEEAEEGTGLTIGRSKSNEVLYPPLDSYGGYGYGQTKTPGYTNYPPYGYSYGGGTYGYDGYGGYEAVFLDAAAVGDEQNDFIAEMEVGGDSESAEEFPPRTDKKPVLFTPPPSELSHPPPNDAEEGVGMILQGPLVDSPGPTVTIGGQSGVSREEKGASVERTTTEPKRNPRIASLKSDEAYLHSGVSQQQQLRSPSPLRYDVDGKLISDDGKDEGGFDVSCTSIPPVSVTTIEAGTVAQPTPTLARAAPIATPGISPSHIRSSPAPSPSVSPTVSPNERERVGVQMRDGRRDGGREREGRLLSPADVVSPTRGSPASRSPVSGPSLAGSYSSGSEGSMDGGRGRARTRVSVAVPNAGAGAGRTEARRGSGSASTSLEAAEPERGRSRSRSTAASSLCSGSGANSPLSDSGCGGSSSPNTRRSTGYGIAYGGGSGGSSGSPLGIGGSHSYGGGPAQQHSVREVRDGRGVGLYRKTSEDLIGGALQEQRGRQAREGRDGWGVKRGMGRGSESLSPPVVGGASTSGRTGIVGGGLLYAAGNVKSPQTSSSTPKKSNFAAYRSYAVNTFGREASDNNGDEDGDEDEGNKTIRDTVSIPEEEAEKPLATESATPMPSRTTVIQSLPQAPAPDASNSTSAVSIRAPTSPPKEHNNRTPLKPALRQVQRSQPIAAGGQGATSPPTSTSTPSRRRASVCEVSPNTGLSKSSASSSMSGSPQKHSKSGSTSNIQMHNSSSTSFSPSASVSHTRSYSVPNAAPSSDASFSGEGEDEGGSFVGKAAADFVSSARGLLGAFWSGN